MSRVKLTLLSLFLIFVLPIKTLAFSGGDWDSHKCIIVGKWSQLFYEVNVGMPVSKDESATFLYFSLGYGKPSTKNAWRKFLPDSKQAAPTSKEEMMQKEDDTTKGLHAGTIGLGVGHYFNNWIGFHAQLGWGFIADLGGGNSSSNSSSGSGQNDTDKSTFIYNSIPLQVGVDFCLWHNLILQGGVTYMWKEIPIITLGLGVTF